MRKLLFFILLLFLYQNPKAQSQQISGVINQYYTVSALFADHIELAGEDLSTLHTGDKVILMQMTGVVVNLAGFPTSNLSISNFGPAQSAGRYEMLAVNTVDNGLKRVSFTINLDLSKYSTSEKFQLIKIYEADFATVTSSGVTAIDWNGSKGGVLAMVIYKKLTLNGNIDASYKGFRGASPENYTNGCRSTHDTLYFPTSKMNRAGGKGESIIERSWAYTKGPGRIVTGGGGGLGYFAGGGGGSNYGSGGAGGRQIDGCTGGSWNASGGITLSTGNFYGFDRVTMGGGGGSSTEDATNIGTKGGDGGGIVILLVDTLVGNNYTIFSRGENVAGNVTTGGAGGGAGGSVLMDVNVYSGNLNINVMGGNGGNTSVNTGTGGGGSGGLIWYEDLSIAPGGTKNFAAGSRGTTSNSLYYGSPGQAGGTRDTLRLPLNGFLFNSVNGASEICEGQQPERLTASIPKGGDYAYIYEWLQSTDSISWNAASGTGDSLSFQPVNLSTTTYFTRRVTSGPVIDLALPVKVTVYPKISGNTLTIRDTLCFGSSPSQPLDSDSSISGGNGTYQYLWQYSINQTNWINGSTSQTYNPGNLNQTTYFRRRVTSALVCTDTSVADVITILDTISNNLLNLAMENAADTAICANLDAGEIHMLAPGGGDGIYRYQWLQSSDNVSYSPISGALSNTYSPPVLSTGLHYYKRRVYSGEGNACSNTSEEYQLRVYPSITGNVINTDSSRYCYSNSIRTIAGVNPSGGNTGSYIYKWAQRYPGESWQLIPGAVNLSYSPQSSFTDTTQFRRIVISGEYNACIDSGNVIQIDIIPQIFNDLVSPDTAICEGAEISAFTESPASGGAGGFSYIWQSRNMNGGLWQNAEGINNTVSYSSPNLYDSTQFRRVAQSQICATAASFINVYVYHSLTNNIINGPENQYTCYNTEKELQCRTIQGGNPQDIRFLWQQSLTAMDPWQAADGLNSTAAYTTVPLSDTIFYRRVVLSGAYDQCLDTSAPVLIRINPLPSGDIVSSIDTACAGSPITIQYAGLTGVSPWQMSVGDLTEWFTEDNINSSQGEFEFLVNTSGQIRVIALMDDSLCYADLSGNSGQVDLKVFEVPEANAGSDDSICGLQIALNAQPSIGIGEWEGNGIDFTDPSSAETNIISSTYGSQVLFWTETNWNCSSSDDVQITFYEQPEEPYAGEDQFLDYKFFTSMNAEPPSLGHGYWQFIEGEGEIADSTVFNTEVRFPYPEIADYTLQWTVINGVCPPAAASITVSIGDIEQYNAFSPNNDGINDKFYFELSGIEENIYDLTIFDRWGNEIARDSGFDIVGWDGKDAAPGTYYYILEPRGSVGSKKHGYIELRK